MRFLRKFDESVGIVNTTNTDVTKKIVPHLQHVGEPIEDGDNISIFQQDWFDKLLPDTIKIHSLPKIKKINFDQSLSDLNTENRTYELKRNDCTLDGDLVQFNYHQNTAKEPGDEIYDGEPDILEFDIHFVKNDKGIKLLVDITYGDNMAYEFSIEAPNKINIIHYTGNGSLYDTDTHWGFCNDTVKDLVKFFNAFNHGIEITEKDLNFLDSDEDSYEHDVYDKKHLYNDDSDLIRFGNSAKLETFKSFSKKSL
jgi:hypothetical protein